MDFHSLICNVCKLPLNELFPERFWFLKYLENEGYVKMLEENQSFVLKKQLDIEIFNKINFDLKEQGWQSLSSFAGSAVKNQLRKGYSINNVDITRQKQGGHTDNDVAIKKQKREGQTRYNNLSNYAKISLNDTVKTTITKITFFGISLKIDAEPRKAIISVSELSDNRKTKIDDFEYNVESYM